MAYLLEKIHPRTIHVVGPKKSGKTTLVRFLVSEFTNRGFRVGSLKHSSHDHPVDRPGSDSDLIRLAGASPSVFATPAAMAIHYPFPAEDPSGKGAKILSLLYSDCDILIVESFKEAKGERVVLASPGEDPAVSGSEILAVVNDAGEHSRYPAFRREDPALVGFLLGRWGLDGDGKR